MQNSEHMPMQYRWAHNLEEMETFAEDGWTIHTVTQRVVDVCPETGEEEKKTTYLMQIPKSRRSGTY